MLTIVVKERDDYIKNAMTHLNDPLVYKPLAEDIHIPNVQTIIEKLKNGLIKQTWFEFCKPPEQPQTSRLYFLKKNPMGIRLIVSSCNSITESISQFVDQLYVAKLPSYLKLN